MNIPGTYVRLKYIGPRKRKSVNWGTAEERFEDALIKAKEWLKANGGRFISGIAMPCSFYDVESNGETIRMQSVPIFSPGTVLNEDQLNLINNK